MSHAAILSLMYLLGVTKMTIKRKTRFGALAAVAAAAMVASLGAPIAEPATAQTGARTQPSSDLTLSVGRGQLINLPGAMTDLFVADSDVADVQVRSSRALYIFGKAPGETTVYATNAAGNVVYSTTVRVGTNLNSVSSMLQLAMPEASIVATPMNGLVLLTGTVVDNWYLWGQKHGLVPMYPDMWPGVVDPAAK